MNGQGKELAGPRPNRSRILDESRERDFVSSRLDAGARMQAAFNLSMDLYKLRIAALRSRGFSEEEIRALRDEIRK